MNGKVIFQKCLTVFNNDINFLNKIKVIVMIYQWRLFEWNFPQYKTLKLLLSTFNSNIYENKCLDRNN